MQFLSEPTLFVALVEILIGIALLGKAADEFVEGAAKVATRARISPVLVGAVIVGFGTSAPELLVSGIAAFNGDLALGLGNIVGSNVANLTLVLGAAALIVPLYVSRSILIREAPLSMASVLLFGYLTTGGLERWEGVLLLAALVLAMSWIIIGGMGIFPAAAPAFVTVPGGDSQPDAPSSAAPSSATPSSVDPASGTAAEPTGRPEVGHDEQGHREQGDDEGMEEGAIGVQFARTLLGLVGTVLGAQLLVWGASSVAQDLGLSGGFVGFTLVAVGTSLPELVTAVVAARKGETELILGNLLGSNLFNSLGVGGVIALVGPGVIDDDGLQTVGIIVMIGVAVAAWFTMATLRRVHRLEAAGLLAAWVITVVILATRATSEGALPFG